MIKNTAFKNILNTTIVFKNDAFDEICYVKKDYDFVKNSPISKINISSEYIHENRPYFIDIKCGNITIIDTIFNKCYSISSYGDVFLIDALLLSMDQVSPIL